MARPANRQASVDADGSLIIRFVSREPAVKDELKATLRDVRWDADRGVWKLVTTYLRTPTERQRAADFLARHQFLQTPAVSQLLDPPPPPPLPDSVVRAPHPVHRRLRGAAEYTIQALVQQCQHLQRLADEVEFLGWDYHEGQEDSESKVVLHINPRFICDGVVVKLDSFVADVVVSCMHCGAEWTGSSVFPKFDRVDTDSTWIGRPFTAAYEVPRACPPCHYHGPQRPQSTKGLSRFFGKPRR